MIPRIAAFPSLPDTPTTTNAGSPGRLRIPSVGGGHEEWQSRKVPVDLPERGGEGWGVGQSIRSASSYRGAVSFKKRHR